MTIPGTTVSIHPQKPPPDLSDETHFCAYFDVRSIDSCIGVNAWPSEADAHIGIKVVADEVSEGSSGVCLKISRNGALEQLEVIM